ncbi:unnamed protein product [Phytophthora fragariaefolia]|uniref:Unnamed protein product n=1 Tax=Phytophthora fragariaefolia TaxID=1490495 RepID=A0A9W6YAU6_9STRA|nr:unnamed protein product [Phytophthora fragariaefolia]
MRYKRYTDEQRHRVLGTWACQGHSGALGLGGSGYSRTFLLALWKRRQHATASDDSDSNTSDVAWTLPSGDSSLQTSDTSSQFEARSASSEGTGCDADNSGTKSLPPPLECTQFNSWESFHTYLNVYAARTFQVRYTVITEIIVLFVTDTLLTEGPSGMVTVPTEMVTVPTELVTIPTETATVPTETATVPTEQPTMEPVELDTQTPHDKSTGVDMLQLRQDGSNEDFDVEPPPQSRGRPKAKPAVVKAKRNLAILMANDASEMHNMNLSLKTVSDILSGEPTFNPAASTLKRFRQFMFDKKPKPPIAWELNKLPSAKTLIELDQWIRPFPKGMLRKCAAKVTALQKKRQLLAERDVAIEVPGVGVFSTNTLVVMRGHHHAIAVVRQLETTLSWFSTIQFGLPVESHFQIEENATITTKLKALLLLSHEVTKGCLSDDTMSTLMAKLFGPNPQVRVASPNMITVPTQGKIWTDNDALAALFLGASTEQVIIPVNCNGNHWCTIMVDLGKAKLYFYDPTESSYKIGVRAAAQIVK